MTTPASLDLMLPFYGAASSLRATVRSVLGQSRDDWRLVVVDDAWPGEDVGPWLRSLGDNRVTYLRNQRNLGISGNFQRCLDLAEADLVAFPGGDDLLMPSYVNVVVRAARSTGAEIIQPGVRVIDKNGQPTRTIVDRIKAGLSPRPEPGAPCRLMSGQRLVQSLLRGNWLYFPSLCWRRDAVTRFGFAQDLQTVLDLRLVLDLVFDGGSVAVTPQVCFDYRRHPESYSSQSALDVSRFDEEATLLEWAARTSRDRGWTHAARAGSLGITSRLHALSLLPRAVGSVDQETVQRLARHALRR